MIFPFGINNYTNKYSWNLKVAFKLALADVPSWHWSWSFREKGNQFLFCFGKRALRERFEERVFVTFIVVLKKFELHCVSFGPLGK